jgi:hypothetical protein
MEQIVDHARPVRPPPADAIRRPPITGLRRIRTAGPDPKINAGIHGQIARIAESHAGHSSTN